MMKAQQGNVTQGSTTQGGVKPVIETHDLRKVYASGDVEVIALHNVDLTIMAGEFVAIMGSSGSGKSTLMNILGCLDYPTSGEFFLDGVKVNGLGRNDLADIRNQKIGFVFQGFNLLPRTAAVENVELPLFYNRTRKEKDAEIRSMAVEALTRVGLGSRLDHEPSQLSGGQQQRVAIARALVNRPALILADEPTGNLDSRTSVEVLALFQELNDQGITVILVTHEPDIAQYTKRVIEMRDGAVIRDAEVKDRHNAKKDLAERDDVTGFKEHAEVGTKAPAEGGEES
jgi:putative ABC transport system ATP-binding protein